MKLQDYTTFKIILKVIESNYSLILDEVAKYKKHCKNKKNKAALDTNFWGISKNQPSINTFQNNFDMLNIVIPHNSLHEVKISINISNCKVNYANDDFIFTDVMVSDYISRVDISGVESKSDYFNLSTVRDFEGIEFEDIILIKKFTSDIRE